MERVEKEEVTEDDGKALIEDACWRGIVCGVEVNDERVQQWCWL